MLPSVKVAVLLTHHFRQGDEQTSQLIGALSDRQAARAREPITQADQPVDYRSFPRLGHSMHTEDPKLFAETLSEWAATLPS